MRVEVRPMNVHGKPLPTSEREKSAPCLGQLSIVQHRLNDHARAVTLAMLKSTDGLDTSALPDLHDASVLWLTGATMRLRGFEVVDGVQYGQTWDIKVLHAKG